MDAIRAVHQCLFCPQTFGSANEKDDHILQHFAHETCIECDQNLIRIGSDLYTRHNAVTCIKIDVKIEKFTEASSPVNHSGYITETEDDITASGSDNDDWSTTFSMIKESICVDERVITESIDECEQANVVLKNEDSDDFLLAPQMNNDNEIEIDPMPMNEVVDDIIEDSLECTQLDSENKPKSDPQLINSIKTNDEKRKIGCNICGKILLATSLVLHKKTQHAPPGTYICRICHKEFPNEQELSKHQAGCLCKTRKKVRCNDCGKMFNKTTIARHKRAYHSPEGTPVCKRCCKIFSNEEELSLHQSVCLLKRKPIEKGHFECDIFEPFNSQQKREIHNDLAGTSATQSQIEHEEEPYTQIKDDIQLKEEIVDDGTNLISFEDSNQQLESESQSHELMRTKPVKRNDIVCDFCGKLFKSQFILQQHQIRFHSAPN
ncbi:zinc finger protein 3 homolog, partial [Contarinia nasturtii]|uniref:zinc finger protein 3 homolog n=1 Tax=Contarinia nasturtii TaxID=265458 RepID=UPI0012D37698